MAYNKEKKYYILELLVVILITISVEFINQYYYEGVFKNYIFVINITFICMLIKGLLEDRCTASFIKVSISIITIVICSSFFTLPKYTYNTASNIVVNKLKEESIGVSLDKTIEYKSIIGKEMPSVFISKWYVIKVLEHKEEKYYYFNPNTGLFFQGEKRRNENSGITNMPIIN